MWYPRDCWYRRNYRLHCFGCGTIAVSDLFLYLASKDEHGYTKETALAIDSQKHIHKASYMFYVEKINFHYTRTLPFLGTFGFFLACAINKYCKRHRLPYRAHWKLSLTDSSMLDKINEMLTNDIPVILLIGGNTPNLWGKRGIPFYRKAETSPNSKVDDFHKELGKFEVSADNNVHSHYVTVTGIIRDMKQDTIMLQISSWGVKYYIDYKEYREYVNKVSGKWCSSLIYIR